MPPRQGPPIIPSQHTSVGGNHGQHPGSNGFPDATRNQLGVPTAGRLRSAGIFVSHMCDALQLEYLLPTDAHNPETFLEDVDNIYDENRSGPNQDRLRDSQYRRLPPAIGHEDQPGREDGSQYSPEDFEDEISDRHFAWEEAKRQKRKRREPPKFPSKLAKRKAAVAGGAGSNQGPRGQVRKNEHGVLEYWTEGEEAWIPAVYHYMIRDKLINKAKTCNADVYRHPRARGDREDDVTAFLGTQKDWDLERDHGWNGIDVLYMFAKLDHETPTYEVSWMYDEGRVVLDPDNHPIMDYRDIPWTLSSNIEGALMEAIRRLDPRITIIDFWARLPKECRGGTVYGPTTLNNRMWRFRWENSCPAWTERKGTDALREYVWHRMTTAAQNANSTRELSKLSKEEQKEARKDNTGKHDANAGGWARAKKGKNDSEEEFQAPAYIRAEGATKPASLRSQKDKRSRPDFNLENYEDKGHKHLSSASEQGRQTHTTKRQKVREPPPSAIHYQDTTPASQIDYRSIPPQNEEDAQHIQRALAMTRANYLLRTGSECAPTARHQCYFHQVLELLDDFASHWSYPADSISLPDLVTSREPWRDGFGDWTVATGGDEGFVKGFLLELCGGRW